MTGTGTQTQTQTWTTGVTTIALLVLRTGELKRNVIGPNEISITVRKRPLDMTDCVWFNKMSALVGHFVSFPRKKEKRVRRYRRGDEREGQGRRRKMNESEKKKTHLFSFSSSFSPVPLFHLLYYLFFDLQGLTFC